MAPRPEIAPHETEEDAQLELLPEDAQFIAEQRAIRLQEEEEIILIPAIPRRVRRVLFLNDIVRIMHENDRFILEAEAEHQRQLEVLANNETAIAAIEAELLGAQDDEEIPPTQPWPDEIHLTEMYSEEEEPPVKIRKLDE
jgi:hypothetical protein